MGSLSTKTYSPRHSSTANNSRNPYISFSHFSLVNFVGNLSGRTEGSIGSQKSAYSVSRPWSRTSRRRWRESTLNNPLESAKTAWPVPFIESSFLPDFSIGGSVSESSFKVLDLISKGAFGKVYKVALVENGKYYAMKVLRKSKIIQESCINQVKDEVRIQTMCGHNPFIVSCPYYWQSKREIFLVSEFVTGGDLHTFSDRNGVIPEDLCRYYVAEISLALDFLHNAGVIYRDLKLENVLLDSHGHVMLIDFGLAKWLKYGDRTNTLCGTLQYMAPEIFSCDSYGHAVDWWALGVLTCYLLTLSFPESGNKEGAGSFPLIESVAVRDLLSRLLQPEPTKRLRSVLTLQTIPFFKDFKFSDVRTRKVNLRELFPTFFKEEQETIEMKESNVIFYDFDSITPTIV